VISHLSLVGDTLTSSWTAGMVARIRATFGCSVEVARFPELPTVWIDAHDWHASDADLLVFDRLLHDQEYQGGMFCLGVRGLDTHAQRTVIQILTRYQRLLPYPEPLPIEPGLLELHRGLFDLRKPLVRVDYDHALDTWRWLLRLEQGASVALQLAALYHDVERLWSEADSRKEHHASNYREFKRRHALEGADRVASLLNQAGLSPQVLRRVRELISRHEEPDDEPELAALNDADALSFFSLNGWGFYRYFGPEHTLKKVVFTLGRMRADARKELSRVRQHPAVAECLQSAMENETR
jgi:hypothetical protein